MSALLRAELIKLGTTRTFIALVSVAVGLSVIGVGAVVRNQAVAIVGVVLIALAMIGWIAGFFAAGAALLRLHDVE